MGTGSTNQNRKDAKAAAGCQVEIIVPAEVSEQKIDDLPADVHLRPGELRIEFGGTVGSAAAAV